MPISFTCGTCGKPYKVDERFAGKKAACRSCGTVNKIPTGTSPLRAVSAGGGGSVIQSNPVRVAAAEDGALPLAELDEEVVPTVSSEVARDLALSLPLPPKPVPRRAAPVRALPVEGCPNCGSPLETGSIFCTGCGFNLKTGTMVATTVADDDAEPDAFDAALVGREPTAALRSAAKWLIIAAGVASVVVIAGMIWSPLAPLGSAFSLIGALAGMVGAVMYFIDGAWEWGLVGSGATMVAMVLLCTIGMRAPATAAPAPAPAPVKVAVTLPASIPAPPPKVVEVSPGRFSVRPPMAGDDPVAYWKPVLSDPDPGIRIVAIGQLAQVPPIHRENAADVIAEIAGDEAVGVRRAAMSGLAVFKTANSVAAALKGLDDPDADVERRAATVLGLYKEESAIGNLISKYPTLGETVLVALARFDGGSREKVVEGYKGLLSGADTKGRMQLLNTLVQSDPNNAGPLLMEYVGDSDVLVRTMAMEMLGHLKYEPAIGAIVERLHDDPATASKALIKYGPVAQNAVAAKLTESDPKARLEVLHLLGETATEQSLPAIKNAAKDPDMTVAMAARDIWRKVAPGTLTPIDEAVMDLDGEKELLIRALKALVKLPVDEHQSVVAGKLFDITMGNGESPIPALACDALAVWADQPTKGRIIEALKADGDDSKRSYAIRLAAEFKDPRAVRPLCECLAQGKNVDDVVDALKDFGSLSETYLMRLFSTGDSGLRDRLFNIFREVGTRRCFMVITPLLNNKDTQPELKKQARETLIAINRRLNTAAARKAPPMMRATPLPPVAPVKE